MSHTCPACGSSMNERTTEKGVLFLVCSKWPQCRTAVTPETLDVLRSRLNAPRCGAEPVRIGELVEPLSRLRILQSQANLAKSVLDRATFLKRAMAELERIRKGAKR